MQRQIQPDGARNPTNGNHATHVRAVYGDTNQLVVFVYWDLTKGNHVNTCSHLFAMPSRRLNGEA